MFFNTKQSKDREAQLLNRFLQCLEDIDDYLDEYDEFFGLAFNEDEPTKCLERLTHFLRERHNKLTEDGE